LFAGLCDQEKQRQMKAMTSELEMYKSQLNEYKFEIEKLNEQMQGVKQEWFQSMRNMPQAQEQELGEMM
jgi:hypothetical protein